MVTLSAYSREALRRAARATGIEYDALERGILHYFTDKRRVRGGRREPRRAAPVRPRAGGEDPRASASQIEPALAHFRDHIAGATYTATDESGDAHKFTANLAHAVPRARGVEVPLRPRRSQSCAPRPSGDHRRGASRGRRPQRARSTADAYVVALGSYSPLLTRPIGIDLPIYPAKGYSATVPIVDAAKAPTVSITDDAAKIVFTRLGERMRIAGTAELSGYSTELNTVRCEALTRRAREVFPGAADYDHARVLDGAAALDALERAAHREDASIRTSTSTPATARSAGPWPPAPARRSRISSRAGNPKSISGLPDERSCS